MYKVTLFFGDSRYGWSETYYYSPTPTTKLLAPLADPLSIMPQVLKMAQARKLMLPTGLSSCGSGRNSGVAGAPDIEYIRVSTVGKARQTAWFDPQSGTIISSGTAGPVFNNFNLSYNDAYGSAAADNPYSAIEAEFTLSNGLTAKRAFSGVPDDLICDQSFVRASPFTQTFASFAAILVNGNWGAASSSLTANSAAPPNGTPIVTWSQDANGRPLFSTATPLNLAVLPNGCVANKVQVYCYKAMPGNYPNLNGVHRIGSPVNGVSGQTIYTCLDVHRPIDTFTNGYVLPYAGPTFAWYTAASLVRTVSRKRGAPFGLSRGRRKVTR